MDDFINLNLFTKETDYHLILNKNSFDEVNMVIK